MATTENKIICSKCNNELPSDSGFCQYCGNKIESHEVESDSSKVEIKEEPINDEDVAHVIENETAAKILASGIIEGQKAIEANKENQPHNEFDADFGLVPQKPVCTVGIDEQERYLQSLRTPTGEPIKWSRRGSMSVNGIHGLIDVYDIYMQSGAEYKTVYINMYGAKNSTIAPKGFVLMPPTIKVTAVKPPKQKEPKVRKPKKPVNKKLVVCLTVIPIAIVILALLAVFVLIPKFKYNHAKSLLENGNYELAYSEFLALDGYSDSENMLLECRYVQAIKYRDAGDYELANKIFESLGNYRDSKILIHKHDYKVSNTIAATCTTAGSETYKCTGCGDSYIEAITLTHAYVVSSSEEASCQKEGYKTFRCSYCNDEYTEKLGKTSHNAVVSSTQEATCTKAGSKQYKCSTCGYEYVEEIAQKAHSYSAATCTNPKICSTCGKTEGTALGHTTTTIKCSRCGEITFKTLTYTGIGSSVISDINLPSGQFRITCTLISGSYTTMDFYYGSRQDLIFNDYDPNSIEITMVSGPINNASIVINGESSYSSSANWKITIEAVGN